MKNNNNSLLLNAITLAGCDTPPSNISEKPIADNEVNVIVLAGQSNAEGCSSMNNIERYCLDTGNSYDEYVTGYEDVKITFHHRFYFGATEGYYSNKEEPFEPKFISVKAGLGASSNQVGPELGIAQYIHNNVNSDRPTYIIKFASGGTGFGSTPNWLSPSSSAVVGDLYKKFIKYVTNGLNYLIKEGLSPKIRALVWMQGEADGCDYNWAKTYFEKLGNMFYDFRNQYAEYAENKDGKNIGIIDGYIADSGTWPHHAIINDAKERLSKRFENYYTIDTNSTGLNLLLGNDGYGGGDDAHYTIDSILKLGNEFGKVLLKNKLLKFKEGNYSDNIEDFSIEDGITRNNVLRVEAEKAIIDLKKGLRVENTISASGGAFVGYFWQNRAPKIRFVVESDRDEENAIISLALSSIVAQERKELPHPMYKTEMVTVNGVPMRINGTMPARNGNNWHNYTTHSGFASLKKGMNYIDVHYDHNTTYGIEEFRLNVDYIEIKTNSAIVKETTSAILEAEVCELNKAKIQVINKNAPSNGSAVEGFNVLGASITGKFKSSSQSLGALIVSFGLNTKARVKDYLKLEVNGVMIDIKDITLYGYNFDKGAGYDWTEFLIADIPLINGENIIKLTTIKDGFDANIDYFRIASTSTITVDPIKSDGKYKFEGEDTKHFSYTGMAGIASEDNSNNPSGGQYIGGLSHTNSSFTFTFNAAKDTTITLKMCVGLVVELNLDDIFDIYLTNSEVNNKLIDNFNIHLPAATSSTWFDWTVITLGEFEVKQGMNSIKFNHPDTSKYGVNIDYILVEADCLIS